MREKKHLCTIFAVTPGASANGSMFTGHTNDGFGPCVVGHELADENGCGRQKLPQKSLNHEDSTKKPDACCRKMGRS
jgi:hypothetical protein